MTKEFKSWHANELCQISHDEILRLSHSETKALHAALVIKIEKVEGMLLDLGLDPRVLMSPNRTDELQKLVQSLSKLHEIRQAVIS